MDTIFDSLNQELEVDNSVREQITSICKELNTIQRTLNIILQRIHSAPNDQQLLQSILQQSQTLLHKLSPLFQQITTTIGPDRSTVQYHDQWKYTIQNLISSIAFRQWLENHTLVTREEVGEQLYAKSTPNLGVDLEDYLHGVAGLPKELSRLTLNAVRSGDYQLPTTISKFVDDLHSGFRMLNLRNDTLRRRFDSIKYDALKIEEILYDLTVRKLNTAESSDETTASSRKRERESTISEMTDK